MKKMICLIGITTMLAGCSSLTKTQVESVNQFAQVTKDFSAFPSKIMIELAEIRVTRGIYYANSLSDPQLHVGELDDIFNQKNIDYEVSDKVDISFKIIDKYAQSLLLLSADKYAKDTEDKAKNFGVDIDSLIKLNNSMDGTTKIPSGIGEAIGKLVVLGGEGYVKAKQAKEIKKFVTHADTLISVITSNLLAFLQTENMNDLIAGEEREITRNYLSFLQHTSKATIENEREYLELKKNIDGVKKLQKQTIEATKDLKMAHKKLVREIEKKKNIKEVYGELKELYEEVKGLKEIIQTIEAK